MTTHRPIWITIPRGSRTQTCRVCGIARNQPNPSHPVHYAERMDNDLSANSGWAIYCRRYGEWTASYLSFKSANDEANLANSDPTRCCDHD